MTNRSVDPIIILTISANPMDAPPTLSDEEVSAIREALQKGRLRDHFDVIVCGAVRPDNLQTLLETYRPHIVHFIGHGNERNGMLLQGRDGQSHPITPRALTDLFKLLKDNIRCVVFNACHTEAHAQAMSEHIDCAIGVSEKIRDQSSLVFAAQFYESLAWGENLQHAFNIGRNSLEVHNTGEQDKLRLYSRSDCSPSDIVFADLATRSESSSDPNAIKARKRQELHRLVREAQLPHGLLKRLVEQTCHRKGLVNKSSVLGRSSDAMIATLWQLLDKDGKALAILDFSESIAQYLEQKDALNLAHRFRDWQEDAANIGLLGPLTLADKELCLGDLYISEPSRLFVTIVRSILTDSSGNVRYRLAVDRYRDGEFSLWYTSDAPYASAEFVQQIVEHMQAQEEDWPGTIEFLLPFELLTEALDQSTVPGVGSSYSIKLCSRHKIVVRSYDRSYGPKKLFAGSRAAQKKIWNLLVGANPSLSVRWFDNPDEYPTHPLRQRLFHDLARDTHYHVHTCLGLTFPPITKGADPDESLLKLFVLAGIPVMVWCRQKPVATNDADTRNQLEPYICPTNLKNLPDVIHRLRQCDEALHSDDHIGNHITLFWDDPTCVPPLPERPQIR